MIIWSIIIECYTLAKVYLGTLKFGTNDFKTSKNLSKNIGVSIKDSTNCKVACLDTQDPVDTQWILLKTFRSLPFNEKLSCSVECSWMTDGHWP